MKRRTWKIVLSAAGAIVLAIAGLVLDANRRAAALLDREREAVKREIAACLARDSSRPPVPPDPIDGNAWDYYGPAVAAFQAIPDELADLIPEIRGEVLEIEIPPDDHAIHNLILQHRPEIDLLRKGARCRTVRLHQMTLDVNDQFSIPDVFRTSRFLAGVVSHEHRMGRDEEALSAAVLGLELAQDFGRGELLVNLTVQVVGEQIVLFTLKDLFADSPVGSDSLAEFACALERLEATRPEIMDRWQGEQTYLKRIIIETPWDRLFPPDRRSKANPPRVWPSWRTFFSERIVRARAVVRLGECFQQIDGLRALSPWERVAAAEAIDHKNHPSGPHGTNGNPLLDAVLPLFGLVFHREAVTRLHWTLLRVSVAIARFDADRGRMPARLEDLVPSYLPRVPICPLTGLPLLYTDGKVWSVGKNRVDEGGVEDPQSSEDGGDHGDVVWRVRGRK